MNSRWVFPSIIIVLQVGAAAVCAVNRDWRGVVYWLAASVIIATVTYR